MITKPARVEAEPPLTSPQTQVFSSGFSLNGELMMDASGSETAFNEVQGDAFVPACTLGLGQRAHLVFGQDINHLKFFTTYGLQEGYEPFCVYVLRMTLFHIIVILKQWLLIL